MPKPRLLLIGWDAADWKVIQPLLSAGQMPHLASLISKGVHGNIATIYPVLSPMLWTSIATGKRAYKHGVHGFTEPLPDGSGVRPISLLSRKTKAVWNILNQNNFRSQVIGWWPSHPAEPIDGVMVSNHFSRPIGEPDEMPPLPPGTIHPPSLAESLSELRISPMELTGEFMRLFVPEYEKVDQSTDKRLHSLGKIIAETMSVHAAATETLSAEPWDFAAVYYAGIDHFGHAFMRYHPPRLPWVSEEDFEIYQHVIANAYRYHDIMLGTLLKFADENTTVLLMSDHGFHPDHLRASYIPAEPAGPAVEHRHFGILCLKGPGVRENEKIFGAGLLDICPTILSLFGLPAGKDMDGKVLVTAFKEPRAVETIESWDAVPGNAGTHPESFSEIDPTSSAEAFKQLVELGYVAPPGATTKETVDECVRELKYNLARAYRDGNRCGDAAAIAEELWTRWPEEHRFGILLLDCLAPLHQIAKRRQAIDELGRRIDHYQKLATAELAKREEQKNAEAKTGEDPKQREPAMRQQFEERQLRERAHGKPLMVDWFLATQALLEKKPEEARRRLEVLMQAETLSHGLSLRLAGALAQLGDHEGAISRLDAALELDEENPIVQAQLASIHFKSRRYDDCIAAAIESLSLLYFQPGLHALLGHALMKVERYDEAEKALCVAVAQSPRNLIAHELLGKLYRENIARPSEALAHEGRAGALRHELARQQREGEREKATEKRSAAGPGRESALETSDPGSAELPAEFPPEVRREEIITVVSGLPRSGTSMMMQSLIAAGRTALTDDKRVADEDNPRGYLEFEKVLDLGRDISWVPQARGKAVKIVAQLLPLLPAGEHYHIVFMERNLEEVIASQSAMLARQGRRGADLDDQKLIETYKAQLQRVRDLLSRRSDTRVCTINYGELLTQPVAGLERLARFLGGQFDTAAAAQSIQPQLRRQKA